MKIKLSDVIDAIEMTDEFSKHYLDLETGQIEWLSDMAMDSEERNAISEMLDAHGFCRLPDQYEINEYEIMESFVETLSGGTHSELDDAIRGRGAFRRFKNGILKIGIRDNWYAYREEALKRIAIEWCQENGIEYEE